MSAFVVSGIDPELNIGSNQRFIISAEVAPEPLGKVNFDNLYVPILGSPSISHLGLRNNLLSGWRLVHETSSTETYGKLKLQKFLNGSTTGIDVLTFEDDGSIPGLTDPKYILQQANANLPNAQALSALSTGIVKNTTTTGILSIAVAGTDYYSPGNPTTLIDDFTDNANPLLAYGNLGVGTKALNSLVLESPTNTYNVAIGPQVLSSLETGAGNTGAGGAALLKLETGSYNSVFGVGLVSLVSGEYNSVLGGQSGSSLTTSNRNCLFGAQIGIGITSLEDSCFIGFQAGPSVNGILEAIGIGKGARVIANRGIAIGSGADGAEDSVTIGWHSNSAPFSVAIGSSAETLADYSVAIGYESGTNQARTVAAGYQAEAFGENSVAVGESAEGHGDDSISLGSQSAALGDRSIAIGKLSKTNESSGTDSIALGANASADGTNSIAIGKDVIVTANNTIALGNGCNVGIGTFSPAYKLDVVGSGGIAINVNSGRIIGVPPPSSGTDAANKDYVDSKGVSIGDAKFIIQTADADLPNAQILGSLATGILKNTTTTGILSIAVAGTDYYSPGNPVRLTASSLNIAMVTNSLGTITTGAGNAIFANIGGQSITSGSGNCIFAGSAGNALTTGADNVVIANNAGYALTSGSNNILIGRAAGGGLTTPSNNIFIGDGAGLSVQTGNGRNICIGDSSGTVVFPATIGTYEHCVFLGAVTFAGLTNLINSVAIGYGARVDTSDSMVLGNNLNVGIGTSSPTQAKLVISGGVTNVASEYSCIRVTGANNATKIEIENTTASTGKLYELRSTSTGDLGIYDRSGGASRLFINTSGNIGVNMTSSILAKLHVTGGVQNVTNEDTIIRATSSANVAKIEVQCTNGSGRIYELRAANDGFFSLVDRTGVASRLVINTSGNIGIGGVTAPNGQLQFPNTINVRQCVFYEAANNIHQHHGIFSVTGGLRININATTDSLFFYAGVNSTTSNKIAELTGGGSFIPAANVKTPKLMGSGALPSTTSGSAAGSAPSFNLTGSELSGTVSVTVGASPSGTTIATFTLVTSMTNSAFGVVFTPANQLTAALATPVWTDVTGSTQFTLNCATALVATNTYKWNYHIIGT